LKYSYIIEIDGKCKHVQADHIQKYHSRVTNIVQCNSEVFFDSDIDFGEMLTIDAIALSESTQTDTITTRASTSFEISEGTLNSLLPSEQITPEQVNHLTDTQRKLFEVLDKFPSCFAEQPGFCPYVEHAST